MTKPKVIEAEIAAIAEHDVVPWRRVGRLLRTVESEALWSSSSPNITSYLEHLAQRLGVTPNVLWRAYAAVGTWEQIAASLAAGHVSAPNLDELPVTITPETIELLDKIHRAARPDDWKALAEEVLAAKIGRVALRARWKAYKDALGGRTARGRGVESPRAVRAPNEVLTSDLDASFVAAFPACLGQDGATSMGLFKNVRFGSRSCSRRYELDFVAVLLGGDERVCLHGVELSSYHLAREHLAAFIEKARSFVDVLWLCAPESTPALPMLLELSGPGVLLLGPKGWRAAAAPVEKPGDGAFSGDTAKTLLSRRRLL